MRLRSSVSLTGLLVVGLSGAGSALAQEAERIAGSDYSTQPMSLANRDGMPVGEPRMSDMADTTTESGNYDYRGVNEFFTIREANPNVVQGQWQVQVPLGWSTPSHRGMDNLSVAPSVTYGVTDDWMVQIGLLPIYFGRGGEEGQGDLNIYTLYRLVRESDSIPAVALSGSMRIPSGDQSSKVDGRFQANVTKTIIPKLRMHLQGYVETANGGRGRLEYSAQTGEHRRYFQWGVGPAVDYLIDDKTLALLNYQNRSSEYLGGHNQNVLQLGVVRNICDGQDIQVAFDIGLDGAGETENLGAAVNYSIKWK